VRWVWAAGAIIKVDDLLETHEAAGVHLGPNHYERAQRRRRVGPAIFGLAGDHEASDIVFRRRRRRRRRQADVGSSNIFEDDKLAESRKISYLKHYFRRYGTFAIGWRCQTA
jgi:hypothetical protein